MYQQILQDLGLSPNEAKIYEALLERGESTIGEIAVAAKVHRRNTYDAIQRLVEKGLSFQIFSTNENRYNAVDPGKLRELIAEKSLRLQEIMPDLNRRFFESKVQEQAFIYRGFEGQKNIWRDILRVGQDSYFIGAKGAWFDPGIEDAPRDAFFKEAKRKKIKFIQLFDYDVKANIPNFPAHFPGDLKYRFLPKKYSTNSGIGIFGDYIVTYTGLGIRKMSENSVLFLIHSKDLAESYRTWFWYMWEQSEEPTKKK